MSQEKEADRPSPGRRIIDGIKEAIAGDFAAVTIDGVRWVRHEDQKAALRTARDDGYRQGVGDAAKVPRSWVGDPALSNALQSAATAIEFAILALTPSSAGSGWRDIKDAPRDGTRIWATFRGDIFPTLRPERPDLERWNGVQACIRHPGLAEDGFDMGWNIAAPVGHGGFPDEWIAGYRPLPSPPRIPSPGE